MKDTTVLLPYGDAIHGQAGSAAQLYHGLGTAGRHHWAVSYALETNGMSVGADRAAFFAQVAYYDTFSGGIEQFFEADRLSGGCKYIGALDGAPEDSLWWVQGGATGWASESSCEYSIWAEVTVGVKVGGLDTGGSADVTLGGSVTCGNGAVLDSEVLIGEDSDGTACPATGCPAGFFEVE